MSRTLVSLDLEWSRLARSTAALASLERWRHAEPALGGYSGLDDVVASRLEPTAAPAVSAALARLAPVDGVAARTLLQMLVPGLVRLAAATRDGHEALDHVLAIAWERIRTYPLSRHGSVAANVLLDVRKRYLRERKDDRSAIGEGAVPQHEDARSPEAVVVERDLIRQIAWARREGLVTAKELSAIVRTRLHGEAVAEAAAAERVNVTCLGKRRWRGERSLRATIAG